MAADLQVTLSGEPVPIYLGENTLLAASFATRAAVDADRAESAADSAVADATDAVEALALAEIVSAAADANIATVPEVIAREGLPIENLGALRGFMAKLDAFSQSEDAVLTIASGGDSVGYEVPSMLADMIAREFVGFMGRSSFGRQELANGIPTPTGTEATGRWTGSGQPSYVLAGGATYVAYPDGATPDPVYLPKQDQHWVIPNGGSVTWTLGLAGSGYRTIKGYLVKESGAGSYSVELLNAATDVVIGSAVTGSLANATIDAIKAEFGTLDTTLGYKLRITCTSGTIRTLGVVALTRRCVLFLALNWGGSYLQQQNRSSKAIFDYINNDLNTAITFVETRGETPGEFAGAGIGGDATSGITNLCTRLNAIPGSKVFIGGKPTTSATNDDAQTALYRAAARANDYVFIDGVRILKDNAAVAAVLWNKKAGATDNVHLNLISSAYLAGFIFNLVPWFNIRNLWNCRKVVNNETVSAAFKVFKPGYVNDVSQAVTFAAPAGANVYDTVNLSLIQSLTFKNPVSGVTASISMSGGALRPNTDLDLSSGKGYWINGVRLLAGQQSGWTIPTGSGSTAGYTVYTAGATLTFGAAYVQAELTAMATRLAAVEAHVAALSATGKALISALHNASGGNLRLLS